MPYWLPTEFHFKWDSKHSWRWDETSKEWFGKPSETCFGGRPHTFLLCMAYSALQLFLRLIWIWAFQSVKTEPTIHSASAYLVDSAPEDFPPTPQISLTDANAGEASLYCETLLSHHRKKGGAEEHIGQWWCQLVRINCQVDVSGKQHVIQRSSTQM